MTRGLKNISNLLVTLTSILVSSKGVGKVFHMPVQTSGAVVVIHVVEVKHDLSSI